jgi:hypothetical protein
MHTSILFQVIVSASTNELTVGIFGGKKQAGPVIQHRAVLKSDLPVENKYDVPGTPIAFFPLIQKTSSSIIIALFKLSHNHLSNKILSSAL